MVSPADRRLTELQRHLALRGRERETAANRERACMDLDFLAIRANREMDWTAAEQAAADFTSAQKDELDENGPLIPTHLMSVEEVREQLQASLVEVRPALVDGSRAVGRVSPSDLHVFVVDGERDSDLMEHFQLLRLSGIMTVAGFEP